MDSNKKLLSLLGIAQKAGYVASGEFSTEKSIKEGRSVLVLVAADASDNTKKMFRNMCSFYKVPLYFAGSKEELGHAIGKELRASLAVLDKGIAQSLEKQLGVIAQSDDGSTESLAKE